MVSLENINYAFRNFKHRKSRIFLTIFSIMIGITTIFIFLSFGAGLYEYVDELTSSSSADKLLIMPKGFGVPGIDDSVTMNDDDLDAIASAGEVYSVSGVYFKSVEVSNGREEKYVFFVSYDPKNPVIMDVLEINLERGRTLQPGDNRVCVLGYNYLVSGRIFEKPIELNDEIEINGEKLKVVGFFSSIGNPADDSQIYTTNDQFKEFFPEVEGYAEIVARVNIDRIDKAIENIERTLRKHRNLDKGEEDFYVQSFDDMVESYSMVLDLIIGFVILIALISVLVSAINTANTMITSVLERYKEIGILKAIGARNSEIFGIFLFESSFLGFMAGIFGLLFGAGITYLIELVLENLGWGFLSPSYNPFLFIGCLLFAVITGAISGVSPAIKASRINTVDALRYE